MIDWGDGSLKTPGHIELQKTGQFAVISAHRYVKRGEFHITVTIRNTFGDKIETESLVRVIN